MANLKESVSTCGECMHWIEREGHGFGNCYATVPAWVKDADLQSPAIWSDSIKAQYCMAFYHKDANNV